MAQGHRSSPYLLYFIDLPEYLADYFRYYCTSCSGRFGSTAPGKCLTPASNAGL